MGNGIRNPMSEQGKARRNESGSISGLILFCFTIFYGAGRLCRKLFFPSAFLLERMLLKQCGIEHIDRTARISLRVIRNQKRIAEP